jgi:MFS family permease
MPPPLSERKLVFLIGSIQVINTLDFMMVMPLGPDFAKALGIPSSDLGFVGGSYTAAAALAVGAFFLDRFDAPPTRSASPPLRCDAPCGSCAPRADRCARANGPLVQRAGARVRYIRPVSHDSPIGVARYSPVP